MNTTITLTDGKIVEKGFIVETEEEIDSLIEKIEEVTGQHYTQAGGNKPKGFGKTQERHGYKFFKCCLAKRKKNSPSTASAKKKRSAKFCDCPGKISFSQKDNGQWQISRIVQHEGHNPLHTPKPKNRLEQSIEALHLRIKSTQDASAKNKRIDDVDALASIYDRQGRRNALVIEQIVDLVVQVPSSPSSPQSSSKQMQQQVGDNLDQLLIHESTTPSPHHDDNVSLSSDDVFTQSLSEFTVEESRIENDQISTETEASSIEEPSTPAPSSPIINLESQPGPSSRYLHAIETTPVTFSPRESSLKRKHGGKENAPGAESDEQSLGIQTRKRRWFPSFFSSSS